jgi:hypothetical protein
VGFEFRRAPAPIVDSQSNSVNFYEENLSPKIGKVFANREGSQ